MEVLAYPLSRWLFFTALGCLGAEVLLFLHLCFPTVFAQQCCVTGGKGQGPESMAVRRVSALPRTGHGTPGKGTASGLRCPLPPPHGLCGESDEVGA